VRGTLRESESVESPPHPKPSASTSPRKRGEVKSAFPPGRLIVEHSIAAYGDCLGRSKRAER
jgi:hypothetical protein